METFCNFHGGVTPCSFHLTLQGPTWIIGWLREFPDVMSGVRRFYGVPSPARGEKRVHQCGKQAFHFFGQLCVYVIEALLVLVFISHTLYSCVTLSGLYPLRWHWAKQLCTGHGTIVAAIVAWVISNRCVTHSSSLICLLLLGCTSTFIIIVLYLGKDLRHPLHPQLKKNTLKLISFAGIQLTDPLMDLSQAGNKKLAHVGPNAVSKNTSYDSFSQKLTRCFQCGRLPVWRSRILDFPKCLTNPNGNFFTWPGDRPWWCYVWSCPSHISSTLRLFWGLIFWP